MSVRSQLRDEGWAIIGKLFDAEDVKGLRSITLDMVEHVIRLQSQYGLQGDYLHPRKEDGTLDLSQRPDNHHFREQILSLVSH